MGGSVEGNLRWNRAWSVRGRVPTQAHGHLPRDQRVPSLPNALRRTFAAESCLALLSPSAMG